MDSSCFPQMKSFKKFGSKRSSTPSLLSSRRDLKLDDKVAIITGAASGIGAATARLFVSNGAKVLIADVKADAGKNLSSELGSSAHFFRCDVTNEVDVAAAVDYAVESWGHLDIMFNNAGFSGPVSGLADINIEEFDQVMAVHIKGAVLGVKHAARVMTPARKGVIIFSGSTSATLGGAGPPLHSAASAAVLCIVRSAAAELISHGIRVNAVSSHCVATPMSFASFNESMNPKPDITVEQFEKLLAASNASDIFTAEKVANAVMFLASDEAGFINGHNLVLDGAFSVTKPFDSSNLKAALAEDRKVEADSNNEGLTSPGLSRELSGNLGSGLGSKASTTAKELEVSESKPRVKDERSREKEEKATQKENKEREKREKEQQIAEEKARAKEEKALAEKEIKDEQKGMKERGKREKEKQIAEEKAPAKEAHAPYKDPKANGQPSGQHTKDEEIHPLDKIASAKEERIRNEKIQLPNAGPEPDVPTEFQSRPPVKRIGRLLSWRRNPSKKERAEDKVSKVNDKKDDKSTDPDNVSKQDKDDKPTDQAKVSEKEKKEDKSTDPSKVYRKEKKTEKSTEPGNVPKKDKDDTPTDPPKISEKETKDDKSTDPTKVSKKEKKNEKSNDPDKVSKREKEEGTSADPGQASKKEAESPAKEENGGTASKDSPTSVAASQESLPKAPSAFARIVRLLNPRIEKPRAKDKKVRFDSTEEESPPTNGAPTEINPASP